LQVPIEGVVVRVLYISGRNVVLENDWNVQCEWLPSQTNLESGSDLESGSMILRRLIDSTGECSAFSDYSSLEGLSLDCSDSSSLEDLSATFPDSCSLVDLLLNSAFGGWFSKVFG
jgi:hypothetical protein